jgi:hypothetical protein
MFCSKLLDRQHNLPAHSRLHSYTRCDEDDIQRMSALENGMGDIQKTSLEHISESHHLNNTPNYSSVMQRASIFSFADCRTSAVKKDVSKECPG